MDGWDSGWGVAMALGMVSVSVALIAAVVLAVVWATRYRPPSGLAGTRPEGSNGVGAASAGTAEQILAERLARGEIDVDEYRARLEALSSEHQPVLHHGRPPE